MKILAVLRPPPGIGAEADQVGEVTIELDEPAIRMLRMTPARILDTCHNAIRFGLEGRLIIGHIAILNEQHTQ